MLALLTRMKLENLLLIVSRWDAGPPSRLGCELFRCLNEQCKELLRELQQAVRASFPPEELLREDFGQHPDKSASISKNEGESTSFCTDAECETQWDETEYFITANNEEAKRHAGRLFDLKPIAATPPRRFRWMTNPNYGHISRRKREAHVAAVRQAAVQDEWMTNEEAAAEKAVLLNAHIEIVQRSGLKASSCPIGERERCPRQHGAASVPTAHTVTSPEEQMEQAALGRRKTHEALNFHGRPGAVSATEGSDEIDEEEVAARQREVMSRMTSEDLLRWGARLRGDRLALEDRLGTLCKASEVIRNVCAPSGEETPVSRSSSKLKGQSRCGAYTDSENSGDRSRKVAGGSSARGSPNNRRTPGFSGQLKQAGSAICSSR
jgi:hypothetical protein